MMSAIVSASKQAYKDHLLRNASIKLTSTTLAKGRIILPTEEEQKFASQHMTPFGSRADTPKGFHNLSAIVGARMIHTLAFSRRLNENICFRLLMGV